MARKTPSPESPEWWVARLYDALVARQPAIRVLDDYYSGNHPLPWLAPQARDDFRRVLKMSRSNYMGLVCDAQAERMAIEGFRVGDAEEADHETWALWQWNNMDAESDKAILEAAITGLSYLLVAPNAEDEAHPFMYVEHPSQCIVEHKPGTNRRERAAALKVWDDDWTGEVFATLYLPEKIYKFRAKKRKDGTPYARPDWQPRYVGEGVLTTEGWEAVPGQGESWPLDNELGEVPVVEIPNNPRLLTGGVSELIDVVDVQDRINKTLADRLITQDYGAFPQKWASAWPDEDDDGNPTEPIRVGRDRMITTPVAETKFGQFDASPLDPYSTAKREDVKDIASRTRTPAQYLLGEMSNVNGETLKASESGLVSKVRQRARSMSDPIEDAVRMLRRAAGLSEAAGQESMEVLWRNPEFRTEGELMDSLVKAAQGLHVPDVALWERWGATPLEISRWKELQVEQARRMDILMAMASRYTDAAAGGTATGAGPASVGTVPKPGSTPTVQGKSGGAQTGSGGGGDSRAGRDADGDGQTNEKTAEQKRREEERRRQRGRRK